MIFNNEGSVYEEQKRYFTILGCFLIVILVLISICNILHIDSKISGFIGGVTGVAFANLWREYHKEKE